VNEQILILKLAVGKHVIRVVSVYVPQVGRPIIEENGEFFKNLDSQEGYQYSVSPKNLINFNQFLTKVDWSLKFIVLRFQI